MIKEEIQKLTGKEKIMLLDKGNTAIDKALLIAKKRGKTKVLIQDQGGWIHYKKAPLKLGMEIIELKTNYGLINLNDLQEKADNNYVLLVNSMPGYCATEKMEEIEAICNDYGVLLINDISGSIGTEQGKIGHILIGSFGEWKPIEAKYGGFIAGTITGESNFNKEKTKDVLEAIKKLPEKKTKYQEIRKKILEELKEMDIIHRQEKGINIIIKYKDEEEKEKLIKYCETNKLEHTKCPRYIRVNEKAISIEVKRK